MPSYYFTVFEVDASYYQSDAQSLILDQSCLLVNDSPDTILDRTRADDEGNDQTFTFDGEPPVTDYTIGFMDFAQINGSGPEYELFATEVTFADGSTKYYVLSKDDNFNPQIGDDLAVTTFSTFVETDYGDLGSAVCYAEGTRILTAQGEKPIETIRQGDRIQTMDSGVSDVLWIGKRALAHQDLVAAQALQPVLIAPGLLNNDTALTVSQQHRILLPDQLARSIGGTAECFVKAKHLALCLPQYAAVMQHCKSVTYYHLLLAQHEVIFANGLSSESLFPGPVAMAGISDNDQVEIAALFGSIPKGAAGAQPWQAARQTLKKKDLRRPRIMTVSKRPLPGRLRRTACPVFHPQPGPNRGGAGRGP